MEYKGTTVDFFHWTYPPKVWKSQGLHCIVGISHCIDRAGGGTKGTAGYYSEASTMKMSGGKSWCIDGPSVNLTFGWKPKRKHLFFFVHLYLSNMSIKKTIKDGDISPWPLDHNCPYMATWKDLTKWNEENTIMGQSYGEDRQACGSCAYAPSARRPCVWKKLDGILCTGCL